ncbi:MAG: hypothetical protein AAFR28_15340 [Pseudomonadota bacterium]
MPNLDKGTVVAVIACPDCGSRIAATVNKNGVVYGYCKGDFGEPACHYHFRHGRAVSQDLQRAYIEARRQGEKANEVSEENVGRSAGVHAGPEGGGEDAVPEEGEPENGVDAGRDRANPLFPDVE